jgi:DNA-binding NarL/FixJ family response regulator
MKTLSVKQQLDPTRILIVGNSPLELSGVINLIEQIPGQQFITETAFDTRSLWSRLRNFSPAFILIDDNIGKSELNLTLQALTHNPKTSDIPIAVIKNSNYSESLPTADIWDYILKQNMSSMSLLMALRNTLKFKRTRQYLKRALEGRKELLSSVK